MGRGRRLGPQVITLQFRFVILPPTGGDIGSVPVNFWLTKQKLTLGEDGKESWKGLLIFNADRRTGARFDAATDNLSLTLGSRTLDFPAGTLTGKPKSLHYTTPKSEIPREPAGASGVRASTRWAMFSAIG